MRKFVFVLILFMMPSLAQATILFRPALTYTIDKSSQSSTTTTTRQLIDADIGYQFEGSNWTLLGAYAIENRKNDSTTENRTSYGLGVGWFPDQEGGFYIDGIYYLSSEDSVSGTTYKGTGWKIDLGYFFALGSVALGPQLTYRDFTYDKENGSSLSPNKTQTNLDPMFAVLFRF